VLLGGGRHGGEYSRKELRAYHCAALGDQSKGIVSYSVAVKRNLLDVHAPHVVSDRAVEEMAAAARERLGADVAVAVSGVGGPASQDGEPPGTVWIGTSSNGDVRSELLCTSGAPEEICEHAVESALRCLLDAIIED